MSELQAAAAVHSLLLRLADISELFTIHGNSSETLQRRPVKSISVVRSEVLPQNDTQIFANRSPIFIRGQEVRNLASISTLVAFEAL